MSIIKATSSGAWGVRSGSAIVSLEVADAVLLLSAASGLAGALVHAGGVPLAVGVAAAYLRLRADDGNCPISSLGHVQTPERAFPGICLTERLTVEIDAQPMDLPVNLIRRIRIGSRKGWDLRPRASIQLVDGSVYRQVRLKESRLDILTLLGRQSVPLTQSGTLMRGHSVSQLDELRQRIEVTLERHRHAVLQAVGRATFERYFTAA